MDIVRILLLCQVDAGVLQYQNQKLVQQLDVQRHELLELEGKIKELKEKQASYDNLLITVNQLWIEVTSSFAYLLHLSPISFILLWFDYIIIFFLFFFSLSK